MSQASEIGGLTKGIFSKILSGKSNDRGNSAAASKFANIIGKEKAAQGQAQGHMQGHTCDSSNDASNTSNGAENTSNDAKNTSNGAENTSNDAKNTSNGAENKADYGKSQINHGTGLATKLSKLPVLGEFFKFGANSLVKVSSGLGKIGTGISSVLGKSDITKGAGEKIGGVFEKIGGGALTLAGIPQVEGEAVDPYGSDKGPLKTDDGLLVAGNTERRGLGGGIAAAGVVAAAAGGGIAAGGAATASPVAVDLNGDGKISTTGASTAKNRADGQIGKTIAFDIDGNGKKEQIEWISGGDGLVVDMTKIGANGEIDGNALMGDQGGQYTDGYQKMAAYDKNADGQLSGAELSELGVWVDANSNGKVDSGELRSVSDASINQLSIRGVNVVNARGETLTQSSANNGQLLTEDVWFAKR